MKPKTIIALMGILAMLAAFSTIARADDDSAKAQMASCIASRNAECAGLSGSAMADCKATGAAYCQAIFKGAFRAAVDYEFLKRPATIAAQAKMLADKSAVIVSSSKPSGDYLTVTTAKTAVSADGIVNEQVKTLNITKYPVDKLVIKEEADGVPIIRPAEVMTATFSTGTLPVEDPCAAEMYWTDADVEVVDATNFEALRDLLEAFTGVLTDPAAYLDLNGDGLIDEVDIDILWASLSDVDAEAVTEGILDYVTVIEALVENFLADGQLLVLSTEFDPMTGLCSTSEVTEPAKKLRTAEKEIIDSVAKSVAEKTEAAPPSKCPMICQIKDGGVDPDCCACHTADCDLGVCSNGCFDFDTRTCLTPACWVPGPACTTCLCGGVPFDCSAPIVCDVPICAMDSPVGCDSPYMKCSISG